MAYTKKVWRDDTRTQSLKLSAANGSGYQEVEAVLYDGEGQEGDVVGAAGLNNIENGVSDLDNKVTTLWNALYMDITGNPFTVSFADLTGISLISGIWNETAQRIEC